MELAGVNLQVEILKGVRKRLELPSEERGPEEIEVAAGVHGLSQIELNAFVDLVVERYQTKRMDPGKTILPVNPATAKILLPVNNATAKPLLQVGDATAKACAPCAHAVSLLLPSVIRQLVVARMLIT